MQTKYLKKFRLNIMLITFFILFVMFGTSWAGAWPGVQCWCGPGTCYFDDGHSINVPYAEYWGVVTECDFWSFCSAMPYEYGSLESAEGNCVHNDTTTMPSSTTTTTNCTLSTTSIPTTIITTTIPTTTTTTSILADCIINIEISPPEGGTTSPPPPQRFAQGCFPQKVRAIPNPGYDFSHWENSEGSLLGYDNPITIDFEQSGMPTVVAVFELEDSQFTVLRGEYTCSANPCESDPCLPGIVWAITSDNKTYYLTKDGEWLWNCEAVSWNGYVPKEGGTVIAAGEVTEESDSRGNPYSNVEVKYLLPLDCPVEIIYKNDSRQTELLRHFRDNVLSRTLAGRELIKLYYLWSPAIVKAMEKNEGFKEEIKELIDAALVMIKGTAE